MGLENLEVNKTLSYLQLNNQVPQSHENFNYTLPVPRTFLPNATSWNNATWSAEVIILNRILLLLTTVNVNHVDIL